jgi:hypothetical protein
MLQTIELATNGVSSPNGTAPASTYAEKGTAGLDLWSGIFREADSAAFQWPGAWPYIDEMLRTNPQLTAVRRMFTQWAGQIDLEWTTVHENPSAIAQERASYANTILDDAKGGGKLLARQLVSTVPFNGFQVWELVPGLRNGRDFYGWRSKYRDGRLGLRKIAIRYLSSHYDWIADDSGEWSAWRQMTPTGRLIELPRMEGTRPRLLHVVFGGDSTNPEGWTPLETAWRIHKVVKGLTFIEGLGHERSAGHVVWTAAQTPDASDKDAMRRGARAAMSAQEGNYIIEIAERLLFRLQDVQFSNATALLESLRFKKMELLALYDQDWQAIATLAGQGAYSTIRARLVAAVDSFNSMMDDFADQTGQQLYQYLFAAEDTARGFVEEDEIKLTATNIKPPVTPEEVAAFIGSAWPLLRTDERDEAALRTISGWMPEQVPEVARPEVRPPEEDTDDAGETEEAAEEGSEETADGEMGEQEFRAEIRQALAELSAALDSRPLHSGDIARLTADALTWAEDSGLLAGDVTPGEDTPDEEE